MRHNSSSRTHRCLDSRVPIGSRICGFDLICCGATHALPVGARDDSSTDANQHDRHHHPHHRSARPATATRSRLDTCQCNVWCGPAVDAAICGRTPAIFAERTNRPCVALCAIACRPTGTVSFLHTLVHIFVFLSRSPVACLRYDV